MWRVGMLGANQGKCLLSRFNRIANVRCQTASVPAAKRSREPFLVNERSMRTCRRHRRHRFPCIWHYRRVRSKRKSCSLFSRARKHCCAARVPLAPQQRYSACIIARNAPRTIIADGSNACVECRDIKKRMALMRGSASDYRSWRSLKEPPTPHDPFPKRR